MEKFSLITRVFNLVLLLALMAWGAVVGKGLLTAIHPSHKCLSSFEMCIYMYIHIYLYIFIYVHVCARERVRVHNTCMHIRDIYRTL